MKKTNYKKILDQITDRLISEVQNGKKTMKISNIQELLDGYDHKRFNELYKVLKEK